MQVVAQRPGFKYQKTLDMEGRKAPHRKIGFGAVSGSTKQEKMDRLIGAIKQNLQCKSWNMPNIDNVSILYGGPLTTNEVGAGFGAKISPLSASIENPPPGALSVSSTMADPGKYQTFATICAIQWRVDFDPAMFVAIGNALNTPTTATAKPVSPDVLVSQIGGAGTGDFGTTAALGVAAGTMLPAFLQWAYWVEAAMFYMSRGYNLTWQYGHNFNILNDQLRYTMFVPTNAQPDSASSSAQSLIDYARRSNAYYVQQLAAAQIFVLPDRIRAGNESLGGVAGQSVYHPSRSLETAGVTYGGGGLRPMLHGNTEFRRLQAPFLAWPGAAIGLAATEQDDNDGDLMRAYLDASSGNAPGTAGATIPGAITEFANLTAGNTLAGTSGQTGVEPSLDAAGAVANSIEQFAQRAIFKGSPFRLTVAMKGWELSPDQISFTQEQDFRDRVASDCGCHVGYMGV